MSFLTQNDIVALEISDGKDFLYDTKSNLLLSRTD